MFVGLGSQQFVVIRARGSRDWAPWGCECFMSVEASEKLQQLGASKLPGKGVGLSIREFFVDRNALVFTVKWRGWSPTNPSIS